MLHPVKVSIPPISLRAIKSLTFSQAATSFECDGCQHHASFHSLENPNEDAVLKKWEAQESRNSVQKQAIAGASRKRKRIADRAHNDEALSGIIELADGTDEVDAELEVQLQEELVGTRRKKGKKGMV